MSIIGMLTRTGRTKRIKRGESIVMHHECICSYCPNLCWKPIGNIHESCGCMQYELMGKAHITHGMSRTRIYRTWNNMKSRCNDTNNKAYKNYGGRGIIVCNEWLDFTTFAEWAFTHGYGEELSIDRTDNDGNYCPANCTWMTKSENTRKKHETKIN